MMVLEDPIELEKKEEHRERSKFRKIVAIDRPIDRTQWAVERPVDNNQQRRSIVHMFDRQQGLSTGNCQQPIWHVDS